MSPLPRRFRRCEDREVFGRRVAVARRPLPRLLGLALLDRAAAGEGLLIPHCRGVHTFGMRFPLDLLFLDPRGLPLRIERGVGWGRLLRCPGAVAVLELPAPALRRETDDGPHQGG